MPVTTWRDSLHRNKEGSYNYMVCRGVLAQRLLPFPPALCQPVIPPPSSTIILFRHDSQAGGISQLPGEPRHVLHQPRPDLRFDAQTRVVV